VLSRYYFLEVLGRYSNPCYQLPQLWKLLDMTPGGCPVASVPSRQKQNRLRSEEIEQLISEYQAGVPVT
jgi:hypothetical protein